MAEHRGRQVWGGKDDEDAEDDEADEETEPLDTHEFLEEMRKHLKEEFGIEATDETRPRE